MPITRRTAIKNFLIISGGIILLPGCVHHEGSASIVLKNISLTGNDEKLLSEIAGTMIPKTDTPGADDLQTHLFTMKMIDDCFDSEHQQQFIKGLKEINPLSKKVYDKTFSEASNDQRVALLNNIELKKYPSKDLTSFYGMMKHLTIEGYMSSKYVGTNLIIYELVPGRFHGTFPIKKNLA